MPAKEEVLSYIEQFVTAELFEEEYGHVFSDSQKWNQIETENSKITNGIKSLPIFKILLILRI